MMMKSLKGRKFTRIKYGKQTWTRVVQDVLYQWKEENGYSRILPIVIDTMGEMWDINEIGLVD